MYVCFTTSHRAKGREWDCIHLLDDIIDPGDDVFLENPEAGVLIEALNILYVAMTRARRRIMYPRYLHDWFSNRDKKSSMSDASHQLEPKEPPAETY